MPVIIPDWYGADWILEALRDEDIMLAGAAPGGPQTLFGDQATGSGAAQADPTFYAFGMEVLLSAPAPLTGIKFYSPPGAAVLPLACCIYEVGGQSQVAGTVNNAPAWSGAAASGWVKCAYDGSVQLAPATDYKVVVYGGGADWYSLTAHYWDTGPGAAGLTARIITAPNNAGADVGQDSLKTNPGGLAYPLGSFNASNYWIDIEITP